MTKKKEVKMDKDLGVLLYPTTKVIETDKSGNDIKCPTLAYAHLLMESPYGTMVIRGFRVLRGKNGNPFVTRPARTRDLFDANGRKVSTQRFNDIRIEGECDAEFDKALKETILSAYRSR